VSSNLGAPATEENGTLDFGAFSTTGALIYTGAGETTDRNINLIGGIGGATIDHSGTGLLKFTGNFAASGIGSKTFTLSASTAATGEFVDAIVDNDTTGSTRLATAFATNATNVTLASVSGVAVGASISGTGIAPGTTIAAVNPLTRVVTLSTPATGAGTALQTMTVPGLRNSTSVAKNGEGSWTLFGANSYTGDTTVSSGTLQLADNATLHFVLGSLSGSNNRISGSGTVVLDGDISIDTSAADGLFSGSWTIVDNATLTETFTSNFTLTGFTDAGSNIWTKANGENKLYTFDESTGVLTLTSSLSYASWIGGFFPGETNPAIVGASADPDNDGIQNAAELVIGGNPATGMDSALAPTSELVSADPDGDTSFSDYMLFTYRRSDLSVAAGLTAACETDADLEGTWTTAVNGVSGVVILTDDNFTFTPAAAADTDRVRVYVPRGSNTKLFGRLSVIAP
jgi:autotransporter-associated beta strand protein